MRATMIDLHGDWAPLTAAQREELLHSMRRNEGSRLVVRHKKAMPSARRTLARVSARARLAKRFRSLRG